MLQVIRDKLTGWIAIAILGLIGVTFVFWGGSGFITIGQQFAAKVDGSEISVGQFENEYRMQLDRNPAWADLPEQFRLQLRQGVLDSLIRDRLIEMYLIKRGYQISDELLTASIQSIPDFQVDGVFDMDTYKDVLLQNGLDPTRFEASQRRALREDQLRRAIGGTSVVTPAEYRRYLNLIAEQRLVSLATLSAEGVADEVEVTEEMITAFYDDNDTMFLTPESADVEFIEVRRDAITETVEISEDVLNDYYENNKRRYLQDEQRQARHILILFDDDEEAAEETAKGILARAQAGEPFEDLAQTYSKDGGTASRGGDLGPLMRSQLPGELGGAIFAMEEGAIEGPIQSDFGFHIVRLDEILERGPLPLDQVRGELLTELRQRESEEAFRELERQLSDALFDAEDMQAISQAIGLEIQVAERFTRSGGEPLGSNQAAIDTVFEDSVLNGGMISEVVELDANRSAVFSVTAYHEASRQSLEEVREQIVAAIRSREAQAIIANRAEELLAALDAGEEFGAAAEAAGAAVSAPMLLSRTSTEVDQSVVAQVFMSSKPSVDDPVTGHVGMADGGATVFSIEAVLPGRPESIPVADRDQGKVELTRQAGIADYIAFVQALYDRADVVISQDALAAQDAFQ